MKMSEFRAELKRCGAEALKSTLSGISTLKLKEIRSASTAGGSDTGFLAYVDVLGHPHVLACEVKAAAQPAALPAALKQLRLSAAEHDADVTPVLIAPYLSPQAQALCKQNRAGYVDLVGNARIELGEVFIGKRMIASEKLEQALVSSPRAINVTPKVPAATFGATHSGRRGSHVTDTAAFVGAA